MKTPAISWIRGLGAWAFVLLAVLFVAVTVAAGHLLRGARLDLTENRLYTLSQGTERLVARLQEPVNLYFFYSREAAQPVPALANYAVRVRELLEEIAARSDGKVVLHVLDPEPFSPAEDRAAEFGLRAVPLGPGGDMLYFGLAGTNSTDRRALIDFFNPQQESFLEYDVARLIQELAAPERRVVGLLSTLPLVARFDPLAGGMQRGLVIGEQLGELFDVRTIPTDATALPADLDALVVVHPKGLSRALLYAVDQYVAAGGPLLLFVDPDSQLDPGAAQRAALYAGGDRTSTFEPLLSAWGVAYDATRAFGDLEHALLVGSPDGGEPVRHLAFAGFGPDAFDRDDVVTGALDALNVGTPGFLGRKALDGVTFTPLITSGPRSAPITVEKLAFAATPESLRAGFEPTGERYVVAARLSGRLPSAYPDGPPEGVAPVATPRRVAEAANVVVVADTDLLSDQLWVRTQSLLGQTYVEPWANNADFVLNALDQLTGGADLIAIRARDAFARPFTRVEELRERADDRLRAKEVELQRELQATEQKLVELQAGRTDAGSLVLTPEQQAEIRRFEAEKLRIRRELREVRRGLDEDIERLGTWLKALNVAAVPLALTVVALAVAWLRRRRRRGPTPA
ncbi:MAG: Gldg family protein [Pseudomonadota bacterium]